MRCEYCENEVSGAMGHKGGCAVPEHKRAQAEAERWQGIGNMAHGESRSGIVWLLRPGDADHESPLPPADEDGLRDALAELARRAYAVAGHFRRAAADLQLAIDDAEARAEAEPCGCPYGSCDCEPGGEW